MGRLIDEDSLKFTNFEIVMCEGDFKQAFKLLCEKLDNAPTVDAEPVRHGKWIIKGVREPLSRDYPPCYGEDEYDEETHSIIVTRYFCSVCDYDTMDSFKPKDNYCPHCGAKMDGE